MAWAKVKLTDVPEMEYYAQDGRGEVMPLLNALIGIHHVMISM